VIPEDIDLEDLRRRLSARFAGASPAGYVRGKGDLRAAVVALLNCSALEAEQLVDTMEARGLIRYEGDRRAEVDQLEHHWQLGSG
jgi:energy-coupling factor transporter transmembrane protein EcfT